MGAGVSPKVARHDAHAHQPKGDVEARKRKGRGDRVAGQLERWFSESEVAKGERSKGVSRLQALLR